MYKHQKETSGVSFNDTLFNFRLRTQLPVHKNLHIKTCT